ncbi:MAG: WD40-repeat-containing domain protein [Monoraphidium minutum]|nr:MAG: WD40-repeat-containing domain protein [Monoraphidium minutum]
MDPAAPALEDVELARMDIAGAGAGAPSGPTTSVGEPRARLLHTLRASEGGGGAAGGAQQQRRRQRQPGGGVRGGARELVVTALAWSQTGLTLAAAFGRHDIIGWCDQPGVVATWNLGRGAAGAAAPDRTLPLSCCATAVAFHPTEPGLLAGGTFSGEVVLWDLGRGGGGGGGDGSGGGGGGGGGEDPQVARSDCLGGVRHTEPVTALAWQHSASEARRHGSAGGRAHLLLSLGADGKLLVWGGGGARLDNPIMGYELRCPPPSGSGLGSTVLPGALCLALAPASAGGGGAPPGGADASAAAAAAAAVAAFVGLEGGQLLRCHLADPDEASLREFARGAAAAAAGGGGRAELRAPVREAGYERGAGAVTGVAASPFQPSAVLACGADGCVRLFHALGRQPVLTIYAPAVQLLGVEWSPTEPLQFAVSAGDGRVLLYDLGRARQQGALAAPALVLDAGGSGSGGGGGRAAAAFNRAAPGLFATAAGGEIKVWQLPEQLAGGGEPQARASKQLARMVQLG